MADAAQDIRLRTFDASPTTIILRAFPVAALVSNDIFLYQFDASPTTIILRRMDQAAGGGASFPTQYAGLRTYYGGGVVELCLVAEADAPTGMGGVWKINKNGTTYAVYLVETTGKDASSVRIRTSSGVKSARLKT